MIDFILQQSAFPLLTAFLLGLLTMISPCPFCSDITAISYLSSNLTRKRALLWNCIFYIIGKCFSYTLLALIFIFGSRTTAIRSFFETYGEPALGPFLIIVGILIAIFGAHEAHHNHEPQSENETKVENVSERSHTHAPHRLISRLQQVNISPISGSLTSFILGAVFALAFCPYSGLLYFGTLIPLTIMQPLALSPLMPIMFGLGDALPVLAIATIISKGASSIGKINGNLQDIEKWLRIISVAIFITMGLILTISVFTGHHHHADKGVCTVETSREGVSLHHY